MASNNKPRTSLLNLFDPLANSPRAPSTPQRDVPSQDKENYDATNNSNLMTAFFNRTCKSALETQPKPLKHRLIDIGDMTLEDAASPEALLDETLDGHFESGFHALDDDDENMTLTFQDMMKAATPNKLSSMTSKFYATPRRSFADFDHTTPLPRFTEEHHDSLMMETPEEHLAEEELDEDTHEDKNEPTPGNQETSQVASPEILQRQLEPQDVPLPPSPVISTFENTSLDWIIEAPDNAGNSFGEIPPDFGLDSSNPVPTTSTTGCLGVATQPQDSLATSVNIPEPHDPLLVDTHISITISESSSLLSSVPELSSTEDSSPRATLRPVRPNTSSSDPYRASVDLQSSFQMLLQSEDMSFDLMRDKDSFLQHAQSGMDSLLYTIEDDPSFDLEVEKVKMVEALKECSNTKDSEEVGQPNADDASSPISSSPTSPTASVDACNGPSTPISCHTFDRQESNLNTIRKRLSTPVSISSPRLIDHPLPPASPNISFVDRESLKVLSPISPVFVAPPAIDRRRSSLPLSTPRNPKEKSGPTAPPPAVPALKVIKRTRPNVLGRQDSTTSTSGSSESGNAGTSNTSSNVLEPRALPTIAPLKTRRGIKDPELQSTPLGSQPTRQLVRPVRPIVKPRLSTTISTSTATTTRPLQARADGPRRFPISESTQAKPLRAATISASSTGPRRPIISASAATMLPAAQPRSTPLVSDLKAPSQSSSVTNTVSSLPKPVSRASTMTSRLPAPKSTKSGTLRRIT